MAVTRIEVKGSSGERAFYFTYPSADVFTRERNYFIFEGAQDDTYIKTIKISEKTLNFGRYNLGEGNVFYLDVSAYYYRHAGNLNVIITFEDYGGYDVTKTITINAGAVKDCYDPFKEITGSICRETGMEIITPPFRMLEGVTDVQSLFCAKRETNTTHISHKWNINGTDDSSDIIMKSVSIGDDDQFIAKYIHRLLIVKPNRDVVDSTITRSLDARDTTRDVVFVTWRTRWGLDVSHVFYLDTYATDKDDAQEVESEYYYKEHSKHVIKGSFYLDNIREPYDLWYYQTLANSELVVLTFDRWNTLPATYMPNGTNSFNGVKITGSNIKDAVVDGVTQSTITFDFEMR